MQSKGDVSDYYSGGTRKVNEEAWQFIALSGLSAYVAEGFLVKVLEDGRVGGRSQELKEHLAQDFFYMESVTDGVWMSIAAHLQWDHKDLKSKVLGGALVSYAYIMEKVIWVAESYPWKLLDGDVAQNLAALAGDVTEIADPVTTKIRVVLQAGTSTSMIMKAVCLLRECVWTTSLTEKQHSGIAVIKKYHPDLSCDTLAARAYLHIARQLLPAESSESKERLQWAKQMERTQRRNPVHIGGRQMFFASLFKQRVHGVARSNESALWQRSMMQRHSELWNALSPLEKQKYNIQAEVQRSKRGREVQGDIDALLMQGELLSLRENSMASVSLPANHVSACAWSSEFLGVTNSTFNASQLAGKHLNALRGTAIRAPEPLHADRHASFVASSLLGYRGHVPLPDWTGLGMSA
eukprot:668676-Amphidinium_carterae.1